MANYTRVTGEAHTPDFVTLSEKERWLPKRKNFYFSTEAWGSLVKQITSLNTEIQKMGHFGMRFRFSLWLT